MVTPVLCIPIIETLDMECSISVWQRSEFIAGQPHAVNDLQRLLNDALVAFSAIEQILPDAVFHVLDAGIFRNAENLSPCQPKASQHCFHKADANHTACQIVEDTGRQGRIEQRERLLVPSGNGLGTQSQRGIQKRTSHGGQIALPLGDPGKSRTRRGILEVALAEKQFHGAFADGRFVRGFFARNDQRSQQLIGYLRLIRSATDALMPVIAVAHMVIERTKAELFDLGRLEFVQRLREQIAGGGLFHQGKSRHLRGCDNLAAPEDGHNDTFHGRGFAAASLADHKQVRVLDARRAEHFLDKASRAPCQHRHRLGGFVIAKQILAQRSHAVGSNGIMLEQHRFDGGIFLKLYHIRDFFAASGKCPVTRHIDPAAIALMQTQRLDAMLHLPIKPSEICLEDFQIAVAAHVTKRNGALVENGLEFLCRGKIRCHEGQAESFAVHGHSVAGHLRFILRHQHFQRMHHEIGQRIDILAALPVIPSVGFIESQLAARRIHLLGALDGLLQGFFAIGRAIGMMYLVPFLPEQLGLAEQPVHLLLVLARPESQRAAERQISLGLAAEFTVPAALPQSREFLAILRGGGLLQYLLVGERNGASGLFHLFLAFCFLLGNVVLVNPR